MFDLFSGERQSGAHSISRNKASDAASGTYPHRHRWTLSNSSRGVGVRRDVRRQRFAFEAAIRRAREKSVAAIFYVVKRFVADMGVPRAFRTENGTEYANSMFVDFSNGLGSRRELTAPYTLQQNGPVESVISRAFKAGHAASSAAVP